MPRLLPKDVAAANDPNSHRASSDPSVLGVGPVDVFLNTVLLLLSETQAHDFTTPHLACFAFIEG